MKDQGTYRTLVFFLRRSHLFHFRSRRVKAETNESKMKGGRHSLKRGRQPLAAEPRVLRQFNNGVVFLCDSLREENSGSEAKINPGLSDRILIVTLCRRRIKVSLPCETSHYRAVIRFPLSRLIIMSPRFTRSGSFAKGGRMWAL